MPESWVNAGHANFILDNLIADGKAEPMIVVMPTGHAKPYNLPRGGSPGNNELFEQYLTQELIPFVDASFRTAGGPQNRAMAGLSMGGGHTIYTGFRHSDLFSALGMFSPGLPAESDLKTSDPKSVKLIWISCGDQDNTGHYERIKSWAESMKPEGVAESFHTYPGGHNLACMAHEPQRFRPLLSVRSRLEACHGSNNCARRTDYWLALPLLSSLDSSCGALFMGEQGSNCGMCPLSADCPGFGLTEPLNARNPMNFSCVY